MKTNRGITLISLSIYLIVLIFVIGIVSTLTKYFYRHSEDIVITNNSSQQYSRLVTYILEDVNSGKVKDLEIDVEGQYRYMTLYLSDGVIHQYLFDKENKKIYFISLVNENEEEKVELCNKIEDCAFYYEDSKIKTKIRINSIEYNDNFSLKIE